MLTKDSNLYKIVVWLVNGEIDQLRRYTGYTFRPYITKKQQWHLKNLYLRAIMKALEEDDMERRINHEESRESYRRFLEGIQSTQRR